MQGMFCSQLSTEYEHGSLVFLDSSKMQNLLHHVNSQRLETAEQNASHQETVGRKYKGHFGYHKTLGAG